MGSCMMPSGVSPQMNSSVFSSPGNCARIVVNLELSIYFTFIPLQNLASCSNEWSDSRLLTLKGSFPAIISSYSLVSTIVYSWPQLTRRDLNGIFAIESSWWPSCPWKFDPQLYTSLVTVTTAAWESPADIYMAGVSSATCVGLNTFTEMKPSWPQSFLPQLYTLPTFVNA